jgi:hypothetical protein
LSDASGESSLASLALEGGELVPSATMPIATQPTDDPNSAMVSFHACRGMDGFSSAQTPATSFTTVDVNPVPDVAAADLVEPAATPSRDRQQARPVGGSRYSRFLHGGGRPQLWRWQGGARFLANPGRSGANLSAACGRSGSGHCARRSLFSRSLEPFRTRRVRQPAMASATT